MSKYKKLLIEASKIKFECERNKTKKDFEKAHRIYWKIANYLNSDNKTKFSEVNAHYSLMGVKYQRFFSQTYYLSALKYAIQSNNNKLIKRAFLHDFWDTENMKPHQKSQFIKLKENIPEKIREKIKLLH